MHLRNNRECNRSRSPSANFEPRRTVNPTLEQLTNIIEILE